MEKIEELKEKLQCGICLTSYSDQSEPVVHVECGHHTCNSCLDVDWDERFEQNFDRWHICTVCESFTKVAPVKFLNDMSTTLNDVICSMKKSDEIEKELREEIAILKQNQEICERAGEHLYKCAECETTDSEQNMQLCETCCGLKFEDLEDVEKNALCAVCTIKKHIRKGHQTVDFYPYLRQANFLSQSSKICSKLQEFENLRGVLTNTFYDFNYLSMKTSEKCDSLAKMARRSKSTKHQREFFNKIDDFIDESQSLNQRAESALRYFSRELKKNLKNVEEWYESRMKNCVDESEVVELLN